MILAKLFSNIYKKGGIVLEDHEGQRYICGKPNLNKPITVKILDKKLNWKLLINPDLSFPEAYMEGKIKIINGTLLNFLNLTFDLSTFLFDFVVLVVWLIVVWLIGFDFVFLLV